MITAADALIIKQIAGAVAARLIPDYVYDPSVVAREAVDLAVVINDDVNALTTHTGIGTAAEGYRREPPHPEWNQMRIETAAPSLPALQGLIQQWRERTAEQIQANEFLVSPGFDVQRCADELASLVEGRREK